MAFQSVPNTALVDILWNNGVNIVENTHYFRKNVPPYGVGDLIALASSVDAWVQTNMKPLCVITYFYVRTEVRGLHDENDSIALNGINTGFGTRAGTALPPQVALSIARKSVLTGRSARGRIYTFGMSGADGVDPDEGAASAAYIGSWITALGALATAGTAVGWTDVTVSRFHNGIKRVTGVTFDIANYVAVDSRFDTRRGRL